MHLTIIVTSRLKMFRSGTLFTYIRFRAHRTPLWVRARNTMEKPPRDMEHTHKTELIRNTSHSSTQSAAEMLYRLSWEKHLTYHALVSHRQIRSVITEDRSFPRFDVTSTPLAMLKFHYRLHTQEKKNL